MLINGASGILVGNAGCASLVDPSESKSGRIGIALRRWAQQANGLFVGACFNGLPSQKFVTLQ